MPYKYSKCGTAPGQVYIDVPLDTPEFMHLSDAEQFLAKVAALVAHGQLDFQAGQNLSALAKNWIDAQYAREELAIDMADTNQPIVRTVASITREGRGPQTHAYDDPTLSPIAFLQAVYHATHLPMSIRIDAACALLPFTEPRPANAPSYGCKIIIGGLGPYDQSLSPEDPEAANRKSQSFSRERPYNHPAQSETPGPINTEMNSNTLYSAPPSPEEIREIKAAVNRLRPDLAHLPIPEFHKCPCGHWIAGEYPCCRQYSSRDPSKMN